MLAKILKSDSQNLLKCHKTISKKFTNKLSYLTINYSYLKVIQCYYMRNKKLNKSVRV